MISEELKERALVCDSRGDCPTWKVMNRAANRLAQIEREEKPEIEGHTDAMVIARAILAEREACADAAYRAAQHVNATADDIASAIRSRP